MGVTHVRKVDILNRQRQNMFCTSHGAVDISASLVNAKAGLPLPRTRAMSIGGEHKC
jgi:hypothetical protein